MTGPKRKGIVLQPRDRHLLDELAVMRVIDREQASRVAPFGSVTRANCRLLALTRAGLLRRFFLGTAAGGKKALYLLSSSGARLVGATSIGPKRTRDELVVADLFVAHQTLINEVYCALKYGSEVPDGMRFRRWLSFSAPLDRAIPLVPDGYVEFGGSGTGLAAFLEVDLSHERLSVWREKVRNYLQCAVSGRFAAQFGRSRFLVLVICDSRGRMESLRAATAALTSKIFRFTTFSLIHERGFWSSIWLKPNGNEPQTLGETP
jgi:hypothetical protein